MKKLLFTAVFICLFSVTAFGQRELSYSQLKSGETKKGEKYDTYVAIDGCIYCVGDIICLGNPSLNKKFAYFANVNQISGMKMHYTYKQSHKQKTIKAIKVIGNSKKGFCCAFILKSGAKKALGPACDDMILDIDAALQSEEVISKNTINQFY